MKKDQKIPEGLTNFDIKNYDACKGWGASEWLKALSERAELRYFLRTEKGKQGITLPTRQVMKDERKFFLKVAEERIRNPMYAPTGMVSATCVLRDFMLTDIIHADEIAGRASWLNWRGLRFRDVAVAVERPTMFYIAIDLNAPDEIIEQKFSHWLKQVRSETGIVSKYSDLTPRTHDFGKWYSQRLLPYLDLVFWSKLSGQPINDGTIGNLLFSIDVDDTRGKLRSLPKNALKLISRENIEALARLCQSY